MSIDLKKKYFYSGSLFYICDAISFYRCKESILGAKTNVNHMNTKYLKYFIRGTYFY